MPGKTQSSRSRTRSTGAINRCSKFNSYRPWQNGTQKPGAMAYSRPRYNGVKDEKFRAKTSTPMTKKELVTPPVQTTSDIGQQNQFLVAAAFITMVANSL